MNRCGSRNQRSDHLWLWDGQRVTRSCPDNPHHRWSMNSGDTHARELVECRPHRHTRSRFTLLCALWRGGIGVCDVHTASTSSWGDASIEEFAQHRQHDMQLFRTHCALDVDTRPQLTPSCSRQHGHSKTALSANGSPRVKDQDGMDRTVCELRRELLISYCAYHEPQPDTARLTMQLGESIDTISPTLKRVETRVPRVEGDGCG